MRTATAHWGLAFGGFGRGAVKPVATRVFPKATANRVEYRRGALTEWYVNGPLGLEQGFTLATAPPTRTGAALTFALTLSGDVTATVDAQGREVTVRPTQSRGHAVLRYRGLTAYDAAGHELRAWLELDGAQLRLRVDDTGARYPVVVDPFVQQAELTAADGAENDSFGGSVAVSGDTVVVGAPAHQVGANAGQGAAYVFVKPAGGWSNSTETAELTAGDGAQNDSFGRTVALSGDAVVVGAFGRQVGATARQGAAYVFETRRCTGDCDATGGVTVGEIITLVNIALGNSPPPECPYGIPSGAVVQIGLIIQAVNNVLNGCQAALPSPTPTSTPGTECGGVAGLECPSNYVCDLRDPTCSTADLAGVCVRRPGACSDLYDPVCGCDGVTYPNDCGRLMAGATLAHTGLCQALPGPTPARLD